MIFLGVKFCPIDASGFCRGNSKLNFQSVRTFYVPTNVSKYEISKYFWLAVRLNGKFCCQQISFAYPLPICMCALGMLFGPHLKTYFYKFLISAGAITV